VRPGGWVVVTTPNQLSVLSLLTLLVKGRFSAFQDAAYPAHRTALLEIDLRRILDECGLREIAVPYTCCGRLPLTSLHYPGAIVHALPLPDRLARFGEASARNPAIIAARGASMLLAARSLRDYSRGLARALADINPDVVHTNGFKMHVLAARSATASALVWHFHEYIGPRP